MRDSAKFTMTGPVKNLSFSNSKKQRKSVKMLIPQIIPDPAILRDLLNDWPQGHASLENLRPHDQSE